MEVLQWCKMQMVCLLVLCYVGIIHIREGCQLNRMTVKSNCNHIFDTMFIVAEIAVLFDGITACSVNFLDRIPRVVNLLLHLGMFLFYELFVVLLFWYWIYMTVGIPKSKLRKFVYILPSVVFGCLTILFLPQLSFLKGKYTNYSMGWSVYACFACVAVYFLMSIAVIIVKHRYIPARKKSSLATSLLFIVVILSLQGMFPETLISCIAATMIIISIFLNMENPTIHSLEHYENEMVMGFATLVENKDDNTGGHIRRSSAYANQIAKNLRKNGKYKNIITKDYLNNLTQAAPMHDIGKIGIPDAILQKKGRLTEEEYEKMKEHPRIGGKIIQDTFGHLFDGEYENMAYKVAMYHHEKWNGKGYPEGRSGESIPLCARIMAVADVFDAVSEKRCYRDALPLEECYRIIREGRGVDFDPDVVDAFFLRQDLIEEIYAKNKE